MASKEYVGKTVTYYYKTPTDKLRFNRQRGLHPTQKPTSILKKIIGIASNENDLVLDCFNGVASTGDAALSLNRRYLGVEIDKKYYDASINRLKKYDNN